MVNVRTRKETGKLFFDFYYQKKRCREYTTMSDTSANRRHVEALAQTMTAEMALGSFEYRRYFPTSKRAAQFDLQPVGSNAPPFPEFVDIWTNENLVRWRRNTQATNQGIIKCHLLPAFKDLFVSEITKHDCLAFRADLAALPGRCGNEHLSAKTINQVMGILSMILSDAADRYGFISPMVSIKRLKQRRPNIQPFTLQEVKEILGNVRPDYRTYFLVRFFTGMRTGEIHGLKWKNVDFDQRQILVRETFSKGVSDKTKTMGSDREIDMSNLVYDALTQHYEATSDLSEYVFCTTNHAPLDTQRVTEHVWYPLLRYLGLDLRRPYQCRHTAATLWLAAGENPEWIAQQLGHVNTTMLFRVYSRFVPNVTRDDGSAFDRLIKGAFPQESAHE